MCVCVGWGGGGELTEVYFRGGGEIFNNHLSNLPHGLLTNFSFKFQGWQVLQTAEKGCRVTRKHYEHNNQN